MLFLKSPHLFGVWGLVYNTPPKHSVWWILTALPGDPLPLCPAREGPALSPNNFFTDFSVSRLQEKAEISNTSEIFFTPVLLQTT